MLPRPGGRPNAGPIWHEIRRDSSAGPTTVSCHHLPLSEYGARRSLRRHEENPTAIQARHQGEADRVASAYFLPARTNNSSSRRSARSISLKVISKLGASVMTFL